MSYENFKKYIPLIITIIVMGSAIGYGYFRIINLEDALDATNKELAFATNALSDKTLALSDEIKKLEEFASGISNNLTLAEQEIKATQNRVGGFEQTVGEISGTVDTLEKLTKTDKQLLQKYSKIYFLNENYTPAHLTAIDLDYQYSGKKQEYFLTESWSFAKNLIDAAKKDGQELYVKSAYRSFAEQESLKSNYGVIYGAGTANQFSADQGYSEHQLGTTIDFITTGLGGDLEGFDRTSEYTWLLNNAYKYGFVLSYPKNNSYYIFEPWHWRFVGVKLATKLHNENKNFYDLDQREIDTYLATLFD
ncbi:MAG: hypothetical protein COU07_00075 [Candidatus Harrisonbacteria bacterium CG10_big_fil_rev_8_21_14_0_10_40_38]|uniref:D-alanyl-D-alanine carboxypeptidase-like core domain-containing protein n=1 Tax=Candidatus Harrisonbacteria bacterium CG10_big_fil_rev_8_21_14_0_10_40_38 TaxID=1974583 RepID=A0A2H0UU45_9BACT|nr:MAG: hypothetical protein COU07_00075 [Candidatus Harrisonbacteria bacterium CG10_big_fil_rev_8_21_14_0_10_40_38]